MSQGNRFNEGKPKWSLVPQSSLIPMVQVLEFGAKKYGAYNWVKGLSIREICESLKRHLDAFMEGEDIFGKGISNCALGKSKSSNGFIWKY